MQNRHWAIGKTLKVLLVVFGFTLITIGAVYALNPLILGPFKVEYLGYQQGSEVGVWDFYYAISINEQVNNEDALSHWVLGLGVAPECQVVYPEDGQTVTTVISDTWCINYEATALAPYSVSSLTPANYTCEESTYTALIGDDPTTEASGVKWEDGTNQLDPQNDPVGTAQIFKVSIVGWTEGKFGETIEVALKTGQGTGSDFESGYITGPICQPTAVEVTDLKAANSLPIGLLAVASIGIVGAVVVLPRRRKSD